MNLMLGVTDGALVGALASALALGFALTKVIDKLITMRKVAPIGPVPSTYCHARDSNTVQVLEHLTSATDDMRILVRDIRDEVRAQNQRDLEVTGPLLDKIKTRLEADDA